MDVSGRECGSVNRLYLCICLVSTLRTSSTTLNNLATSRFHSQRSHLSYSDAHLNLCRR